MLDRRLLAEVVGVVDPLQLVALRLGAADEQRAAGLRAEVLADVEVGDERPAVVEREARRRRHGEHLLAQRAVADAHVAGDAGHPVDDARVRTADVDDDRRLDDVAAGERHAAHATVALVDPDHGLAEPERRRRGGGRRRARLWAASIGSSMNPLPGL